MARAKKMASPAKRVRGNSAANVNRVTKLAAPKRTRDAGGGLGGAANVSSKAQQPFTAQVKAAGAGGIKAKRTPVSAPAADTSAAKNYTGKGRSIGGGAAAGATGNKKKDAFGISPGTSYPDDRGKRGPSGGLTSGSAAQNAFQSGTAHLNAPTGHVPSHTFASATMPRGAPSNRPGRGSSSSEVLAAPKANSPDNDSDDATPSGSKRGKQGPVTPSPPILTNELSTPVKRSDRQAGASAPATADDDKGTSSKRRTGPNEQLTAPHMGFKAAASAAAKSAGVSPQAGAAMVAAASQHASPKAKAANPRLAKVARKGTSESSGGKFS
jgi:hypothetical protein